MPSDWTIDSLKEHFDSALKAEREHFETLRKEDREHFDALRKADNERHEQRFRDQQEAVKTALASAERAVEKALGSADRAVEKEEKNSEKWRENANEWRGAMNDRERNLIPRIEAENRIKSVSEKSEQENKANSEKIAALNLRVEKNEGKNAGFSDGWKYLLGGMALIATILSIAAFFIRKG